jgi:hypothetical protein
MKMLYGHDEAPEGLSGRFANRLGSSDPSHMRSDATCTHKIVFTCNRLYGFYCERVIILRPVDTAYGFATWDRKFSSVKHQG